MSWHRYSNGRLTPIEAPAWALKGDFDEAAGQAGWSLAQAIGDQDGLLGVEVYDRLESREDETPGHRWPADRKQWLFCFSSITHYHVVEVSGFADFQAYLIHISPMLTAGLTETLTHINVEIKRRLPETAESRRALLR
jgi:hypothetical protein